jgi:hypothetical protein
MLPPLPASTPLSVSKYAGGASVLIWASVFWRFPLTIEVSSGGGREREREPKRDQFVAPKLLASEVGAPAVRPSYEDKARLEHETSVLGINVKSVLPPRVYIATLLCGLMARSGRVSE